MFKSDPKKNSEKFFQNIIQKNDLKRSKKLIKKGIDWSYENEHNNSISCLILHSKNMDLVKFAFEENPEFMSLKNSAGLNGFSNFPTLRNQYWPAVIFLIDKAKKEDLSAQNPGTGKTLLMHAARNNAPALKLLIEKDVPLNEKDTAHNTALMHAIEEGKTDTVGILLDAGADVHIKNRAGNTPLDVGKVSSVAAIKDIFLEIEKLSILQSKSEERKKKEGKKKPPQETWVLMGEEEIAHSTLNFTAGRKLTTVFNFLTEQHYIITENLETKAETTSPPVSIRTLPERTLHKAAEELKALGGTVHFEIKDKKFKL